MANSELCTYEQVGKAEVETLPYRNIRRGGTYVSSRPRRRSIVAQNFKLKGVHLESILSQIRLILALDSIGESFLDHVNPVVWMFGREIVSGRTSKDM